MKGLKAIRTPVVAAVCLGLVLPVSAVQGGDKQHAAASRAQLEVADVALDAQGGLQGVVVDVHGAPQPSAKVVVVQQKREVGQVQADKFGRFRLSGLRGGVYVLQSGGQARFVRAWANKAAPPTAKSAALIVTGDGVVRGQMPLEQFFASDAFVIVGLVAAMIAIPIALHNQGGSSSPASP